MYIDINIHKPFDFIDTQGKFSIGDIGIYDKYIIQAVHKGKLLRITTPSGVCIVDPKAVAKSARFIFRYYKLNEPMKLYCITPDYIKPAEPTVSTLEAMSGMPDKYKDILRAKFKAK